MRRDGKVEWETKTLGEVCGFVRGPFGGCLKKSGFVEDGFAVYDGNTQSIISSRKFDTSSTTTNFGKCGVLSFIQRISS